MKTGRERDPGLNRKNKTVTPTINPTPPSTDESKNTVPKPISPKTEPLQPSTDIDKTEATSTKQRKPKEKKKRLSDKKKRFILLLLLGFFVLILGFFVGKFIRSNPLITSSENSDINTVKDNSLENEDDLFPQEGAIDQEIEEQFDESENVESKSNTIKENVSKTKLIRSSASFPTPCWVIAYSANSEKFYANTNYGILEALGYDAGIYWIPKYFPNGKNMYKVYVGPFNSIEEAEITLPSILNIQPAAYIMKIAD